MELTQAECYKALLSHDRRFDGIFFTCVRSTKIYCRPVCPTHAPKLKNCSFVASAAEAEAAGYRPCLRCRPELAPSMRENEDGSPAQRLAHLIDTTLLMETTLGQAARAFEVTERHLRRLFIADYGVEPKQYLTTRRLLFAKQLLQDTAMPITDIAFASGFNTAGRLTINMREAYGFTPQRLRKEMPIERTTGYITLRADYRPPFDWDSLLHILKGRATILEKVEAGVYHRTVDGLGITVTNVPAKHHLNIQIPAELSRQSHTVLHKVRALFDLDANPLVTEAALSADPLLGPLIDTFPGQRVPGCWDGFELMLRVVLGQQVSVAGATTLMRRLCEQVGMTPAAIAGSTPASIAAIGLPAKRAATIWELGREWRNGSLDLDETNPQRFYDQLVAIPGIGPWTAEYLSMRVLHWPDAFPAGDLGLQKALLPGGRVAEKETYERAKAWRPWRAYAAMYLWKSLTAPGYKNQNGIGCREFAEKN